MQVSVAGNIGAGKTSLTKLLANHYKWQAHYEDVIDNPSKETPALANANRGIIPKAT